MPRFGGAFFTPPWPLVNRDVELDALPELKPGIPCSPHLGGVHELVATGVIEHETEAAFRIP
jgi:hypothetical protein